MFVKPINQPIKSCMTVVFKLYTMFWPWRSSVTNPAFLSVAK